MLERQGAGDQARTTVISESPPTVILVPIEAGGAAPHPPAQKVLLGVLAGVSKKQKWGVVVPKSREALCVLFRGGMREEQVGLRGSQRQGCLWNSLL